MTRSFFPHAFLLLAALACGCTPMWNPNPPTSESQVMADVRQLTGNFTAAGGGQFTPDMRWVIFNAAEGSTSRPAVYLAQFRSPGPARGACTGLLKPIRISPAGAASRGGIFSPDGNSLLFVSMAAQDKEHSPGKIFRADGWAGAVAALRPGEPINLARHFIPGGGADMAAGLPVSFSPDGKWILFTDGRKGRRDLYAMHPDGTARTRLTRSPVDESNASISPDGRRVVYQVHREQKPPQIFAADLLFDARGNLAGLRNERRLSRDGDAAADPIWHPDGRHIVYAARPAGGQATQLFAMRADGSRQTRLTFSADLNAAPSFSADGHWILWTSTRAPGGKPQLFIARFIEPPGW